MLLHSFDKHLVQAYRLTYTHCDACTVQTTHSMRFGTPATMCIKIERSYLQKKKQIPHSQCILVLTCTTKSAMCNHEFACDRQVYKLYSAGG